MSGLPCSRQRTTKVHFAEIVCDQWNAILLANQVERHAYPESVQFASSPGLPLTVRESQLQGFGASLDVREGSMPARTSLPGARRRKRR